jgi:hypothetical protein
LPQNAENAARAASLIKINKKAGDTQKHREVGVGAQGGLSEEHEEDRLKQKPPNPKPCSPQLEIFASRQIKREAPSKHECSFNLT